MYGECQCKPPCLTRFCAVLDPVDSVYCPGTFHHLRNYSSFYVLLISLFSVNKLNGRHEHIVHNPQRLAHRKASPFS